MKSMISLIILIFFISSPAIAETQSSIKWQDWSDNVFVRAEKENKLVILDLEAIWCHWCHVMDKTTYIDPKVVSLLNDHYIAVKVDQDSRPDLSSRYKEYGWPATIIFSPSGTELVKRSGYIEPEEMQSLLEKLRKNPVPVGAGEKRISYSTSAVLDSELKKELEQRFFNSHDSEKGGLTLAQKFLDSDTVEYALLQTSRGNEQERNMARQTLDANLKLFDHVWGGVYQYSTHYDWNRPHYEKIMSTQTNNLRIYALAYGLYKDQAYLDAAISIVNYMNQFLKSPRGAFYTSQDADVKKGTHSDSYFKLGDSERRSQGIPAVDKNIYARENGWVIQALLQLYNVTGESVLLEDALTALNWIEKNRRFSDRGFSHGEKDEAGPFLGDNLAMGRAYIAAYAATGDRKWLKSASSTFDFIEQHFRIKEEEDPGYYSSSVKAVSALPPIRRLDENIKMARALNLLFHYTGEDRYKSMAQNAMRFISTRDVALDTISEPGILLAAEELAQDPVHLTVVGSKEDKAAKELHKIALSIPRSYIRVDWWDRSEGKLPNQDVTYPELKKSAAFVCTENRCSLPLFNSEGIYKTLKAFGLLK